MSVHASYFQLPTLKQFHAFWDRKRNPYLYQRSVSLRNKTLTIYWTSRASRALDQRSQPLWVDMQLYFSCVVKKRVEFSDQPIEHLKNYKITDKIFISFRAVQSDICDPNTFASDFPIKQTMDNAATQNMRPHLLQLDYIKGRWIGEFFI